MFRVILEPRAVREYKKLPQSVAQNIKKVVTQEFASNPFSPFLNVIKLQLPLCGYRLRIGDYRVLFTVEGKVINIYAIRHRKDAYR